MESSLPEEIVYADDCDFIKKKLQKTKDKIYENAKKKKMKSKNLLVNKEKTEYTTMKRGSKEEEKRMERCDKTGIKTW